MEDRKQKYIDALQKMIRIETVSDPANASPPENFEMFHSLMWELFPHIRQACDLKEFNGSLLLKWKGSDESKAPVIFMNHHDVVPASPEGWKYPPFSGELAEGMIWGRGTLDDKGGLFAMFQAADELAAEGWKPERDIYFETACNEETFGAGASEISEWLRENGIAPEMIFDEGGDIVYEPVKGAKGNFAMIGIGEKSVVNLKFTARSEGGHASTPGRDTPLVRLGRFMAYVENHQVFDIEMSPAVAEMLKRFAPYMGKTGKVMAKADRLRKPLGLVFYKMGSAPAALVATTIAFTLAGGGQAPNAIPREVWVVGDMRCSHHQGKAASIAAITRAAKKFGLETEILENGVESRLTDYNGRAFRLVEEAVLASVPGVDACSPYVMTGGSDSRYFDQICDQIVRFLPFTISAEQMDSIHGINECVGVDTLIPAVDFYRYMLVHV